jgi:acetylornithine deacetylase
MWPWIRDIKTDPIESASTRERVAEIAPFNGHVDVIPAGPLDAWSVSPWEGKISNGKLYGRGASDMKSGLAAMTMALDAVLKAGLTPQGDIFLEYTVDEELSGNGTLA